MKKKKRGHFQKDSARLPKRQNKKIEERRAAERQKITKKTKGLKVKLHLLLILGFAYVYLIFISSIFQIKHILVHNERLGNNTLIAIASEIKMYTSEQIFRNLPLRRDNLFLLKKDKITEIISEYTPIDTLKVHRKIPDTIEISFDEAIPSIIWREENGTEYLIDRAGNVLNLITENTYPYQAFVVERSTTTDTILTKNDAVLDGDLVDYILEFQRIFNEHIEEFSLTKGEYYEERPNQIRVYTSEGWYMLLDKGTDPYISTEDLKAALEQNIKSKRLDLEYMDLRIPGKIFYK